MPEPSVRVSCADAQKLRLHLDTSLKHGNAVANIVRGKFGEPELAVSSLNHLRDPNSLKARIVHQFPHLDDFMEFLTFKQVGEPKGQTDFAGTPTDLILSILEARSCPESEHSDAIRLSQIHKHGLRAGEVTSRQFFEFIRVATTFDPDHLRDIGNLLLAWAHEQDGGERDDFEAIE